MRLEIEDFTPWLAVAFGVPFRHASAYICLAALKQCEFLLK